MYTVDTPNNSYKIVVFGPPGKYVIAIWTPTRHSGSLYPLNADNKVKSKDKEDFSNSHFWLMLQDSHVYGEIHGGCPLELVDLVHWIIDTSEFMNIGWSDKTYAV